MKPIRIALSKGRVAEAARQALSACGFDFQIPDDRLLTIQDTTSTIELLLLKAQDVPVYVEKGVADLGVVGSDVLYEQRFDIFSLSHLNFGHCSMCLCGPKKVSLENFDYVRLASKYPETAKRFLQDRGLLGDVTYLSGSVELAPLLGVSDFIIDIVESGKTLAAHDLIIHEELFQISSVLIANKIRYKLHFDKLKPLINSLIPKESI